MYISHVAFFNLKHVHFTASEAGIKPKVMYIAQVTYYIQNH